MSLDLVILNADVLVTSAEGQMSVQKLNIGVRQGKISQLSTSSLEGQTRIDATGLLVLPGIIDSQVHFREPGLTHKEDLESGTRAAAQGGVTSVFEMPNTNPPTTTLARLEEKMKLAQGRCWVNYAFFAGGSAENIDLLPELESQPGCSGIKIFMGSSFGPLLVDDDATLEKVLRSGRRRVIIHAEDEALLKERKQIALDAKHPRVHHEWRNVESALKATQRILGLARKTGRPVHVLHVTSAEEVDLLSKNKDIATFEITPNHLVFHAPDCYESLGTRVQMNPPIRELRHQQALWRAVQNGAADVIGTDHAPHTLEEKNKEYPGSPSGMPGVQTVVPLLLNFINEGKLSLNRFVELMCENPRRVFGCTTKGRVIVGGDADFTIVDMKKSRVIEDSQMESRVGWTPFAGMKVTGLPTHTIVGGQIVMQENQLLAKGQGTKVLFA